jgi:HEAT repeat protein
MNLDEVRAALDGADEEARRQAIALLADDAGPAGLALLLRTLGDASWRVRKDAVARVVRWPEARSAIDGLIVALLDEGNVPLRNAASEALIAIGRSAVGPLIGRLSGTDSERKLIVDALGLIGDRQAVPALVDCLADPDTNIRVAAAEALGGIGGDEVVQALTQLLPREVDLVKVGALEALVRNRQKLQVEQLSDLLFSPVCRRLVVTALGFTEDAAAVPFLLDALADRGRAIREAAVVALTTLAPSLDRGALINAWARLTQPGPQADAVAAAATTADQPETRRAAVELLALLRSPSGVRPLALALTDDHLRQEAATALVGHGPMAVPLLLDTLGELDAPARAACIDVLARLDAGAADDSPTVRMLVEALRDEDPEVAFAAANALAKVGGRTALGPLFKALDTDEPELVAAAAQALGHLGDRFHDDIMLLLASRGIDSARDSRDVYRAVHLCRMVAAMGRPGDRRVLLGGLKHEAAALRKAAADGLARLGRATDVATLLVYALADESADVRAAVARALGGVGGASEVSALAALVEDEDPAVRAAAGHALGELGAIEARPTLRKLAADAGTYVAAEAIDAVCAIDRRLGPDERNDDRAVVERAAGAADAELAKSGLRALVELWPALPATQAALLAALAHPAWDVRQLAVQALAIEPLAPAVRESLTRHRSRESDALVAEALDRALGQASGVSARGE